MADVYMQSGRGSNRRNDRKRRTNLQGTDADMNKRGQTQAVQQMPLRRNRARTASELGGRTDQGGGPTKFTSDTNPELEQDLASGGRAPGRTLQQDISATRERTQVSPLRDPGRNVGRPRAVSPTLSRRQLAEQERRARHDASSAQARARGAAGSISGRGPTRSQQGILAGTPTAGEFLKNRVDTITAAQAPNQTQALAQEQGLRRLEGDRQFNLDERSQQIDQREQDINERINLRRDETTRQGDLLTAEANRENNRRENYVSPGNRVVSTLWQNEELRTAAQERFGTENAEEIAKHVDNNMRSMAERTNWEEMSPHFQTQAGRQQLQDLTALGLIIPESEADGPLSLIFGSSADNMAAQDYNTVAANIRDFAVNGEMPRLFGPSYSQSGGRVYNIGGIPPEGQYILRDAIESTRQNILQNGDSATQLQMAENEYNATLDQVEEELSEVRQGVRKTDFNRRPGTANAVAGSVSGEEARANAERFRELQQRKQELEAMDPAGYLAELKNQQEQQNAQGQIDDRLRR